MHSAFAYSPSASSASQCQCLGVCLPRVLHKTCPFFVPMFGSAYGTKNPKEWQTLALAMGSGLIAVWAVKLKAWQLSWNKPGVALRDWVDPFDSDQLAAPDHQGGMVGSQRNELLADLRSTINKQWGEIRSSKGQWVVIGSAVGGQTAVEGRTVFVLDLVCVEVPGTPYFIIGIYA